MYTSNILFLEGIDIYVGHTFSFEYHQKMSFSRKHTKENSSAKHKVITHKQLGIFDHDFQT
ncbi:hypothetical protein, partial [Klebsiella pneumoniae]|uniref:hypothetical protein n=1 Tax=Klebsiella pneumoniae TaxID=573 RepID=UPI00301413AA